MHRLRSAVTGIDTPVGYENMIDEAIKTIRHFSMKDTSPQVEKEKQKVIDNLVGIKKNILAGILHAKKSAEEEQKEQLKIAGDIVNTVQSFTQYITNLESK